MYSTYTYVYTSTTTLINRQTFVRRDMQCSSVTYNVRVHYIVGPPHDLLSYIYTVYTCTCSYLVCYAHVFPCIHAIDFRQQNEREKQAELRGLPKLDRRVAATIIQKVQVYVHVCTLDHLSCIHVFRCGEDSLNEEQWMP